MVDSATRMSTMARIPAENTLTISHVRDSAELAERLSLGTSAEGMEKFQALVVRRLHFNEETCEKVKEALKKREESNKSWKKLELRNIDGDITAAISTCVAIDATQEVKLVANNTEISNEGWMAICEGLRCNSILQRLRITTTLEGTGLQLFVEGLHHASVLQILDFSWSTFENDDAVEALTLGLRRNCSLTELHLMGCCLKDEHVAWIVGGLRDHPTLECLDLNGNKCGQASSFALAELVSHNTHLRKLDLSFQTGNERLTISLLVEALHRNCTLRTLDLSNCRLDDEDVIILGRMLCECKHISELFIARNKITDMGISALARMLPNIRSLRRLSLWGNPFDDQGAQALALGMSQNCEIEDVDLFRNFFCSDKILLYTHLNRAGRRLLLTEQPIPLGVWPLVLSRANEFKFQKASSATTSDLIFHLIRGPALFESR